MLKSLGMKFVREFVQFGDGWLYSVAHLARAYKTLALGGFCALRTGVIMVLHKVCAVSGNGQKPTIITTAATIIIVVVNDVIIIVDDDYLHQFWVDFPEFPLQQLVLFILLVKEYSSLIYFTFRYHHKRIKESSNQFTAHKPSPSPLLN